MRFVSPRVHGVLDYLFGALFLIAPFWFDFMNGAAQLAAFVVGGSLLLVSLLTRYPLGALRVIPFPVHGGIELVGSVALIALPWLAGFQAASPERDFFVATGIILLALWATTDYKAAEAKPGIYGRQVRTGSEATARPRAAGGSDIGRAA
ncbi:hypothetical protein SAMN02745121_07388 [Nannocystis exedens]|uniref:SPW repeat-containing integral membrane domain-containing protein n=1 Tax=Nannocystis exedens TaxID=54 RepID=A0A1I2GMH2_9BACT|nr:hypothetical protein [Nannocystis exedens]PCC73639.1 hypothetical protein NAEX_06727 [Nannocystis exedens]SFF18200.1 hypothetical protein SAMN02745121_07388 [Nannocystis exedens]